MNLPAALAKRIAALGAAWTGTLVLHVHEGAVRSWEITEKGRSGEVKGPAP